MQLAREIDLLLVARADLDERVLPWGRLREPLDAARSADALLVNGTQDDAAATAGALGVSAVFRVTPRYEAPRLVEPFGAPLPAATGRRVVAVAGIARPERFFVALRAAGWDVARELVFQDHHWFGPRDLEAMRRAVSDTQADLIITTEKDAVRLGHDMSALHLMAYLPMQLAIEPAAPFAEWLAGRLRAARQQPAPEAA